MITSKANDQNTQVLWDEGKISGAEKLDAHIPLMWNMCAVKGERNGITDVWNITTDFIIRMRSDFSQRYYTLSHALSEAEPFCS